MKKKICIIYTGGTIGMVPSEHGYVTSKTALYDALEYTRDLKMDNMPNYDIVQFDPLLDSSDMSIAEWNKIGEAIADRYEQYDGFIILHGTDTMSYSASALSFMLENLDKPVIFTGAQIPLCEIRSDGYRNIVTSFMIAADGIAREVCIYFDGKLIRGCRSTKMSSTQFAAFDSPNYPVIANAGVDIEYRKNYQPPERRGDFHLIKLKEVPVGTIKMYPGIQMDFYEKIMTEQLKGVILETFGAGNIPTSTSKTMFRIIEKARNNGTLIVVSSQCIYGTVSLGTYETSKALIDIGAISGMDMTNEAMMTKLIYLFSKDLHTDEISKQMMKNVCGELDE